MSDKIYASMAYLPQRKSAKRAFDSMAGQVNKITQWPGDNELGDANKFHGVTNHKGYLFTIDDDLLYPDGYVDYMIYKIEEYNREAVITLHGKIIVNQPISSFYGSDFMKFRCLGDVNNDTPVHIPGTGVMAWHSDTIQFEMSDFKRKNMADVWAGIKCENEGVKRICVEHEKGWIQNINDDTFSCYESNKYVDDYLTETINSIKWS